MKLLKEYNPENEQSRLLCIYKAMFDLEHSWKYVSIMLTQLKARDANTKLSHVRANGHLHKNHIPFLHSGTSVVSDHKDKADVLLNHLFLLVGTSEGRPFQLDGDFLQLHSANLSH